VIRVLLPGHLRRMIGVDDELEFEINGAVTAQSVVDAIEHRFPMLRGTIRDHRTKQRRAYLRYYACEQDISHDSPDAPLPGNVASGAEPFLVIGAISGG
jgi:hypothetical protein